VSNKFSFSKNKTADQLKTGLPFFLSAQRGGMPKKSLPGSEKSADLTKVLQSP
jgi:hypothetical protein